MKSLLLLALTLCVVRTAVAQSASPTARDLIDQDLQTLDLPPFEWNGPPDPLHARLGIYFNRIPDDSVAAITGRSGNPPWFVIWQVMPHWSADRADILIGDTLIGVEGRSIGDSIRGGEDYVNTVIAAMKPGDTVALSLWKNGAPRVVRVPLIGSERVPMAYTTPRELGPVRSNSWLAGMLRDHDLFDWAVGIQKQMRVIADEDFSTVRFAGRPNPWRLNAITYLHHFPTRLSAYSRLIDADLWSGADDGHLLPNAIAAAARHLDVPFSPNSPEPLPTSRQQLTDFLASVDAELATAYASAGDGLERTTRGLKDLLDPNGDWESSLDTVRDPVQRRRMRNAEEDRIAALFATADHVDLSRIARAAARLVALADSNWLRSFAARMVEHKETSTRVDGVDGEIIAAWPTPSGMVVVGGPGANRYSGGNVACIIDLGGDDRYELSPAPYAHARFIADLGGDDVYDNDSAGQAAGIGCVDVLVDLSGNDTYRSDHFSQGAGLLGVGVLADYGGDDMYAAHWAAQGAAFLGIGLLYDGAGADDYRAGIYSQGFAYAKGFGALLDASGNDNYRAGWEFPDPLGRWPNRAHIAMSQGFGFGMRPWTIGIGTNGGIGVLSDRAGDDLYASDQFSQGGSYWYALGILHDAAGADRYTAGQYSQGSGIHLSFGALLDDGGDDMYDGYAGLEQGNAHDWSSGCLEDLGGKDSYRAWSAAQGSALNVAFAWLLDRGGDDQYFALRQDTTNSQGGGNYNQPRKHGSLGLLLDFGKSHDTYTDPRIQEDSVTLKGNRGMVVDE